MPVKSMKTLADALLKPPRTQEILGTMINRGQLNDLNWTNSDSKLPSKRKAFSWLKNARFSNEVKKDGNFKEDKGEIDG